MAGVVSTEQWSIREKLCLASSVIRSGDQNWVSVSRAIKPFGEPGRQPDWFSQKNCACQYSALLETVDTPKRKRSERGEVVDTPGDLIVHKMTKERIVELKALLEEDKIRYRELQREIEQIRSGQIDDKLQSMWNDIQEQKQAAQEAEEAQRIKAELAKAAAAAAKSASKPTGFQLTNKRRPPIRTPSASSRTLSETSSVGENVEVEDTSLTSPIKVSEDLRLDDVTTKDDVNSASAFLTSIVAAKLQEDQDAATANPGDGIPTDGEAEEAAEKLLAATASDLVDLLSPYPEDSSSSQSIDESSLPTPEVTTPAPRVKEPLILKIEKGVVKTREPKIETKISKSEETEEVEIVNVDEAENDQRPSPDPEVVSQQASTIPVVGLSSEAPALNKSTSDSNAVETKTAKDQPDSVTCFKQTTPKRKFKSPPRKLLGPEEHKAITKKLDDALYETHEQNVDHSRSDASWLRSIQDRKKAKLTVDGAPTKPTEVRSQSEMDPGRNGSRDKHEETKLEKQDSKKVEMEIDQNLDIKDSQLIPSTLSDDKKKKTMDQSPPISNHTTVKEMKAASETFVKPTLSSPVTSSCPSNKDAKPVVISAKTTSPRKSAIAANGAAETTKHVELSKPRTDPGDEYIEPPSPEDASSRDDGGIKIKRKAARGRPPVSQRKSNRIRTQTATDEEDLGLPDTPTGRRTAGKDSTMGTISSLIDEDSKDTHSEAGDSDMTDKPSESDRDDLSTAAAGTLQSALFLDSLPSSPASVAQSEEDHAYKIWRKAIMLVWRAIASHKYANVFLHPVTEDIAPGYKSIVLRPMDLITIKKNIENGVIRTIDQFHRDMMLMFQNAIMYNNADQHVHQIATIMQGDVIKQIEEFVSTQLLVHQPDSTKMLRGRGKQGHVEEDRSRRSSTDTDTSGKKRRTRADEN